ncbi:MAG: hypothetical protein H8E48_05870 [Chloroflexi bacterium]|nr:hypothetical protein [Chloroflexota bacterium]
MTEEMIASLADVDKADITERERLAVHFAEKMATDHHSMGDDFFTTLRTEFTDPEIFELGMIAGQFIGYGRLISILDLENPDQPD